MAILGNLSTFKGGHYFGHFQGRAGGQLKALPAPKRVLIPLRQRGFVRGELSNAWAEPKLLVSVGDPVKVGQVIARDDDARCSPVHATISGKVSAIKSQQHPFGGSSQTVVIDADGKDDWVELTPHAQDFAQLSPEQIGKILYEAGVADLGLEGFPTAYGSALAEPGKVKYLVVNAVNTEPYVEAEDALLYEEFDKFATGIKLLRAALGNVEVHVGIGYNKPRIVEELQQRIPQEWCSLHPLLPKYPQGEDEVLVRTLLNLRVPLGGVPSQVGALVCDVQQAVAAYEAVLEGRPLVERAVSLAGSAVQGPANVRVRIGTPLSELVKLKSAGITVLGGVMRGAAVADLQAASVLRDTKAVVALPHPQKVLNMVAELGLRKDSHTKVFLNVPGLEKAADAGLHGLERACVRCGYCFDVCPQNLAPIMIADFVRMDKLQDAKDLHMNACVECGLCTYVCPSKIPVMSHIQEGKRKALE